jgi:hypothetical protein
MTDLVKRLRDNALFTTHERCDMFIEAAAEIDRLQEAKRRALALADERAKEANELQQRIEVLETSETNEMHRLRALVKGGLDAINAAICQTQAEQAGHDRTADKYCRTVEQWRKDARAELARP